MKALHDRERYLSAILETTQDGFWVLDAAGLAYSMMRLYDALYRADAAGEVPVRVFLPARAGRSGRFRPAVVPGAYTIGLENRQRIRYRVGPRLSRPGPFCYTGDMDTNAPRDPGIAIVTGASSGIGAAFARHLAAAATGRERYAGLPRFDELWLIARRGERLAALAEELRADLGGSGGQNEEKLIIRTIAMDLVAEGSVMTLAAKAGSTGKAVRLLINNAGYGTYGPFSAVDLLWQLRQIDLNCRVLTETCGRLDSLLAEGSVVVNVASLAAFAPLAGFAVYAATKAYVLSFSVALAEEWRSRRIRVQALCPGPVESEFALVASGGARKKVFSGWSADLTVKACLRDAGRGRKISLPKLTWRLQRLAAKLAGPVLSARFAQRFLQRPHPETPAK